MAFIYFAGDSDAFECIIDGFYQHASRTGNFSGSCCFFLLYAVAWFVSIVEGSRRSLGTRSGRDERYDCIVLFPERFVWILYQFHCAIVGVYGFVWFWIVWRLVSVSPYFDAGYETCFAL